MTTVYPVPYYLNDPKNDETGINYEVNGILMVNGGGCHDFIFYITSSVKTSDGIILTEELSQSSEINLPPTISAQTYGYSILRYKYLMQSTLHFPLLLHVKRRNICSVGKLTKW
ncbi:uncharacterized protein LOC125860816 isoform X2 [Solanum stenotomum]|uniref:uncharacterized protein LOC125860816 isoform X2 n=1 Tax=Solanum stenotomum TaxID=172797 RepID=UPI0020D037B2|nr:uncharacterized protein LOC125860816 isoform X2 [Solanum stenotomum]